MSRASHLATESILDEALDAHANRRLTAAAVGLEKSNTRLTRLVYTQHINCYTAASSRNNLIRPEVGDVFKLAEVVKIPHLVFHHFDGGFTCKRLIIKISGRDQVVILTLIPGPAFPR